MKNIFQTYRLLNYNLEDRKKIESLFEKYLDDECTPDEIRELVISFDAEENTNLFKKLIREQLEENENPNSISDDNLEYLSKSSFNKMKDVIDKENKSSVVFSLYRRDWFRFSAAAAVLFLVSFLAVYLFRQGNENKVIAIQNENYSQGVPGIPSNIKNAILILDDGTNLALGSSAEGYLADQGDVKISKLNGGIIYKKINGSNMDLKPFYNTIVTGKGNNYELIMVDGSKVWLNDASSIRFPSSFNSSERKVEITGEVYFEVAHDVTRPFKVIYENSKGLNTEIEVLGTHFNVNAYNDEAQMRTTLLEGSVQILNKGSFKILSPGEQAVITPNDFKIKKNVNTDKELAWKNGDFIFDNIDLYTLMRQISRWYDIEVEFDGKVVVERLSGKLSRNVSLSEIIQVLELYDLRIIRDGRKIAVGLKK